jgi:outer membrane protein TolC
VSQPITLEQAVALALNRNLGLATERFTRDAARESLQVAEAPFDPVFQISSRFRDSQQAAVDPEIELTASQSDSLSNSASLSKLIETGATVTVTTNAGRSTSSRASGFNPQYDSDVAVTVRQPLLRGAGIATNRASRMRASIGVDRTDMAFRGQAMNLVRDTEVAFFDLLFATRNLEVQRSGLDAAERFLQENEARRRAGLATELDIMQARVGVANRRASIINAEQRLQDTTDRLLALLGYEAFEGALDPQGVSFSPPDTVDTARSFNAAVTQDPDVLSARELLKQLEIDVRTATNQRLPRLDLGGTLGYSGREGSFVNSLELIPDRTSHVWQVDLTLNIPWGMRDGKSRVRTAHLNVYQQEARLRQLEQDLLIRVRSAVRAVESDAEAVEVADLSAELSDREYQLEKAKFDAGLSTGRFVVEAQQRADEAHIRRTQSQILLRQDLSRLRRIEGSSLEHYGIDVMNDENEAGGPPPAPEMNERPVSESETAQP